MNRGFTIIELGIVMAIIGILAAIAIPQFIEHRRIKEEKAMGIYRPEPAPQPAPNQVTYKFCPHCGKELK